ncbi:HPP family protein [Pseudoalteromonas luteoviolacea]|uniref:HPP transmembrane region domain-containing protein n=1 Tax=Pseudoalteromonas luteoviolacea S4054 TaxID=1129367 RepID=A0A0F6AAW2_9GAMM|nr:HPP family protein [Pseudoalteromonas luteoviolacea]AOT08636.1 hypothetical protein S4054249_12570 [Pseudoalteromonas luteoviolacea]AOT13551.1 hypothetical protein S40542_12545 [Pseudoalteromonas luteoviolacea]AOT18464.1 hypothetical protein S4054_12545 [Pseudoalteromonas luteoviolacea]KKE82539.1 hypothetical protein N479_18195 [Pseudoalteromonas luteoviolacea S4054]KZN72076.1 hypothetical protein N481_16830 [Pseudoalteromonas luteoviolacea S4047-1]
MSTFTEVTRGFFGGFFAVWGLGMLSTFVQYPLLMAPFGATCVLLFAVPHSPLSKPKNVIGGHLLSGAIGLLILLLLGTNIWTMALGVGSAIAAMQIFKIIHPPAGATPLVIIMAGNTHLGFLLFPILFGCIFLVAAASILNAVINKWPKASAYKVKNN